MDHNPDWKHFNWEHTTPEHGSYKANMKILRKLFLIVAIAGVSREKLADYMALKETELKKIANETL